MVGFVGFVGFAVLAVLVAGVNRRVPLRVGRAGTRERRPGGHRARTTPVRRRLFEAQHRRDARPLGRDDHVVPAGVERRGGVLTGRLGDEGRRVVAVGGAHGGLARRLADAPEGVDPHADGAVAVPVGEVDVPHVAPVGGPDAERGVVGVAQLDLDRDDVALGPDDLGVAEADRGVGLGRGPARDDEGGGETDREDRRDRRRACVHVDTRPTALAGKYFLWYGRVASVANLGEGVAVRRIASETERRRWERGVDKKYRKPRGRAANRSVITRTR